MIPKQAAVACERAQAVAVAAAPHTHTPESSGMLTSNNIRSALSPSRIHMFTASLPFPAIAVSKPWLLRSFRSIIWDSLSSSAQRMKKGRSSSSPLAELMRLALLPKSVEAADDRGKKD